MSISDDLDHIQIQIGNEKITLLEFRKSKKSGDVYARLGIPDVGLHYSFHKPKLPDYPLAHLHLRSHPLQLHEDILDFDPNDLVDYFKDFAEGFIGNISEPEPDESITMLPLGANTFSSGNLNLMNLIQSLTGTYYRTRASRLPKLVIDKPSLQGTIGFSDNGIILPFDKNSIFEIPFKPNFDYFNRLLLGKPLNSLIDPLQKALERIQRNSPDSLSKWIPPSLMGSFVQEIQSTIKQAKPYIIDY
jgi:hypothetical protein